ncbi:unnamed protein product, partial [Urochloa humidicola]
MDKDKDHTCAGKEKEEEKDHTCAGKEKEEEKDHTCAGKEKEEEKDHACAGKEKEEEKDHTCAGQEKEEEKDHTCDGKEKEEEKDPNCICKGVNTIVDEKEMDPALSLNKGTYNIMSCSFDVRICKRRGVNLESFDHLRNFRHTNAIPQLDYYVQAERFGRLVVPKVRSSFKFWFDNGGKKLLFDENSHMTA